MTYEQDRAQMEAERNAAEDEYFDTRSCSERDRVQFLAAYERGWNERNKKVIELQELLDAITVGFFPTQDQLREWEQRWQAKRMDELENQVTPISVASVQYYYRNDKCLAYKAEDGDCICWYDEGTGPCQSEKHGDTATQFAWRVKPCHNDTRKDEIESLRAHNDKLYTDYINERILRHEAEAAVGRARLAIASLEAKCNAETERCAKIAREYGLSPVVGKAIAALIMEGR